MADSTFEGTGKENFPPVKVRRDKSTLLDVYATPKRSTLSSRVAVVGKAGSEESLSFPAIYTPPRKPITPRVARTSPRNKVVSRSPIDLPPLPHVSSTVSVTGLQIPAAAKTPKSLREVVSEKRASTRRGSLFSSIREETSLVSADATRRAREMKKKSDVEEDLEASGHCMTITSLSPAKKSLVKHCGYSPQKQALEEQHKVFLETSMRYGAPSETEIARRIHAPKSAIRKREIAAEERIRQLEEQCKKQAAELEAIKAVPVHDTVELGALPSVNDVRVRELEEQVQRERAETTRLNEAHVRELEEKRVLAIAHEQDVLATETARLNIEHEQTLAALRVQLTAEKREELRIREGELTAAYARELAGVRAAAITHEREALEAETERLNEAHARALVEAREIAAIHEREALAAEIARLDREREQALAALRGQLATEREEQLRAAREAATRAFDVEHAIRVRAEQDRDAAALLATQRQELITQLQQQLAMAPNLTDVAELAKLRRFVASDTFLQDSFLGFR